ncbi:MAG: hypothetical protein HZB38_16820, partial [Planctomycetes bacterium]|nr:hypothetical protein [Planctomycetota bacterium]
DPTVRTATQAYYCVVLAYNVDKPLAERWGVTDAPGVALIGSNGRVLETSSGFIDRNTLLALFKKADGEAPPAPASTTAPKP